MRKILVFTMCLLFYANVLHAQTPYWQRTPHKMPFPVSGGQAVYDLKSETTKLYVLGGYSDSLQQTVDWIQEYDVNADSWKVVGRMLQPRKQFVAGIYNGNVVYFGGAHDTSSKKTTLEIWNMSTQASPTVYDVNPDFARSYATGYVVGDIFYMFGGSPPAGGKISYIASYNLATKTISWNFDLTSEDKPREQMTFLVNNNIYVFGGAFNGVLDKIQKFNIPPQKGEYLNFRLLEKRAGGSAVYSTIHKKGFLIAGYNETNPALKSVEEVVVNGDGSLKISKIASLKYGRYNPMAVDYKGIIAVFGGKDSIGKVVSYVEMLLNIQTDVKETTLPSVFELSQNFPNPFNPTTKISYQIAKAGFVSLKIYTALGEEIATLVNEYKPTGYYENEFSVASKNIPSGIYFARLSSNDEIKTIKMMLLK